jgi:hypothetical protein
MTNGFIVPVSASIRSNESIVRESRPGWMSVQPGIPIVRHVTPLAGQRSPTEDQPGDVNDQYDKDGHDDDEDAPRIRDELAALRLDLLGAILGTLEALRLPPNQFELIALQDERLRLPLELHALVVADLLEALEHPLRRLIVHGSCPQEGQSCGFYRCDNVFLSPKEIDMDEETLNLSIRKFLKMVGIHSQRTIEQAVAKAIGDGAIKGNESFSATMRLQVAGLDIDVTFDGTIDLQ